MGRRKQLRRRPLPPMHRHLRQHQQQRKPRKRRQQKRPPPRQSLSLYLLTKLKHGLVPILFCSYLLCSDLDLFILSGTSKSNIAPSILRNKSTRPRLYFHRTTTKQTTAPSRRPIEYFNLIIL